jgi:hypothetical protein
VDLEVLKLIPVHDMFKKGNRDIKFLSDYVPEAKIVDWGDYCKSSQGNFEILDELECNYLYRENR